MFLTRHLWNAFVDWAEVVRGLEGNDTHVVDHTDITHIESSSSSSPRSKSDQDHTTDEKHSGKILRLEAMHSDCTRDLSSQNLELQHENVRQLRWQDKASTTIKKMIEEAHAWKHEVRAVKKAAFRE